MRFYVSMSHVATSYVQTISLSDLLLYLKLVPNIPHINIISPKIYVTFNEIARY
jgi:hypothetical protein